jgi:hypothetical protein
MCSSAAAPASWLCPTTSVLVFRNNSMNDTAGNSETPVCGAIVPSELQANGLAKKQKWQVSLGQSILVRLGHD